MAGQSIATSGGVELRHAHSAEDLTACFPVISALRPALKDAAEWVQRAQQMAADGYRVLAVWQGNRAVAMAGYRVMDNLIHGHFLYIDDLITLDAERGKGWGAELLREVSVIGVDEGCQRLVLDTAATNTNAQRFYKRQGLLDLAIGFVKALGAGR